MNARRPSLEQLDDSICATDPARGEDRDIDAGESFGEDVIEKLCAAHVAASLDALSHDVVAPDLGRLTASAAVPVCQPTIAWLERASRTSS